MPPRRNKKGEVMAVDGFPLPWFIRAQMEGAAVQAELMAEEAMKALRGQNHSLKESADPVQLLYQSGITHGKASLIIEMDDEVKGRKERRDAS